MISKMVIIFTLTMLGILILSILIHYTTTTLAQTCYQINWWTVGGGGGVSPTEKDTLMGTIRQHDAGKLGTGEYSLQGGFWVKGILEQVLEFILNLPLVLR